MTFEHDYALLRYCLGHINPTRTFLGCLSAFHGSQDPKCLAQALQGSYCLCHARAVAQRVCHFLSFSCRLRSLQVGGGNQPGPLRGQKLDFSSGPKGGFMRICLSNCSLLSQGRPGPPTVSLLFPGQAEPPWISRCGHGGLLGAPHSQTMATLLLLRPFQA